MIILQAHDDDAIFSIGSYMQSLTDVRVITTNGGIPKDEKGMIKHTTLQAEHKILMDKMGFTFEQWDYLDDVYPFVEDGFYEKLLTILQSGETILAPLGIHHPDHVRLANFVKQNPPKDIYFYEELPYRVLYPELAAQEAKKLDKRILKEYLPKNKIELVSYYKSQVDDELLKKLNVTERVWQWLT